MHRLDGIDAGPDEADGMTITVSARAAGGVSLPRQAALGVAAVAGFLLVRGAVATDMGAGGRAVGNTRAVEGLGLGTPFAGDGPVGDFLQWVYGYGHWLVAVAVLVWLARRHPAVYYRVRDAMLLTAAGALFVFVVFPVVPPGPEPAAFASLPSLHAAVDALLALAIAAAARRRWVRAAGVGLAAGLAAAVVLTGHHHAVDVLAGVALAGAAWLFLRARHRPAAALRGYAGWDALDLH
ncbi:phosphatase PAP2 family protein [Dactylosporangium salmoneum]|uniref:Inositolphosphotransferase Aur1/Ipt1 domain-containing protein n=1 Tax=Dactylosporangium salmoneum TaxID=53361 RepID=A0ABP5SBZ5_9ACTN